MALAGLQLIADRLRRPVPCSRQPVMSVFASFRGFSWIGKRGGVLAGINWHYGRLAPRLWSSSAQRQ